MCGAGHDETSFRFRQRSAALLPDRFRAPRDRTTLMRDIYRLRSSIVHRQADPEEVRLMLSTAERLLKVMVSALPAERRWSQTPRQHPRR